MAYDTKLLSSELAALAVCHTDHPAKAAAALLAAATAILCATFEPRDVCAMLNQATREALDLANPASRA